MNINLMRKIDYIIGVPFTFFISIIYQTWRLFIPLKKNQTIKRVLFIELSEMGSVILADPAINKAKNKLNSDVFFLIFDKNKLSLGLLNTIPSSNIFILREDNILIFLYDALRFLIWARKNKIDTVVDLELFSRATAILSSLCGATYRSGFYSFHNEGLYRGNTLTHRVLYNPHIHIAKNFVALVNALLTNNNEKPYSKTKIDNDEIKIAHKPIISEKQKQIVIDKIKALYSEFDYSLHKIILINSNASDLLPQRCWPMDNFIELSKQILNYQSNTIILLTGAKNEISYVEKLHRQIADPRCINFAGQIQLSEFPVVCSIAKLLISNDSGPGHFASTTDIQSYVIFGPETPLLYRPIGNCTPIYSNISCSPCVSAANHRKTPCTNNVCVKIIKPEFVFNLIKKNLYGQI